MVDVFYWVLIAIALISLVAALITRMTRVYALITIGFFVIASPSVIFSFPASTDKDTTTLVTTIIWTCLYFAYSVFFANAIAYGYYTYRRIAGHPVVDKKVIGRVFWWAIVAVALYAAVRGYNTALDLLNLLNL